MLQEGLIRLQQVINIVAIPTNYQFSPTSSLSFEAQANIALNYDLGLRARLFFELQKDIVNDYYSYGNLTREIKTPKSIDSFLISLNPDSTERSVAGGIMRQNLQTSSQAVIEVPSNSFNYSEVAKVNVVDFYDNSIIILNNVLVKKPQTTSSVVYLEKTESDGWGWSSSQRFVKIIDSSGQIISFANHEVLNRQIYSNSAFTPILEYGSTF